MVAAIADAVIGPMPGMLANRRLTAFVLWSRTITSSTASIRSSEHAVPQSDPAARASRASAGTSASPGRSWCDKRITESHWRVPPEHRRRRDKRCDGDREGEKKI
jgi:hypothetical protein